MDDGHEIELQPVARFPEPAPEPDPVAEVLADLARCREACLTAMESQNAFPADKVRASAELRLVSQARLALLGRRSRRHQGKARGHTASPRAPDLMTALRDRPWEGQDQS